MGTQERVSKEPVIDVATRKEYMYFIDKEGYVARAKYATNKLSDEESAKRDLAKKEKKIAWEKKKAENQKKREEKETVRIAKLKQQLKEAVGN